MANFLVYDVSNFRGLIQAGGSTVNNVTQCDGFDAAIDQNGSTIFHGFLTKYPKHSVALGDTIGTEVSRGLFLYVPSDYGVSGVLKYLQAFSDGTLRYLNPGGAWTTLNAGFDTNFPFDFAAYIGLDRAFWSEGKAAVYKWKTNWSAGTTLKDKSATAIGLTGTLTFTEDDKTVTGAGTAFDTELVAGDWIRKSAATQFYEVDVVTDANNLELINAFAQTTGAGALNGSEKAGVAAVRGRFLEVWKDRLIISGGDTSSLPIVGLAIVDDATTPLP